MKERKKLIFPKVCLDYEGNDLVLVFEMSFLVQKLVNFGW